MRRPRRSRRSEPGHTFVELLVTIIILSVLASAVLPVAEATRRREKEIELRRALRDIRQALFWYHEMCLHSFAGGGTSTVSQGTQLTIKIENDPGSPPICYPKDLDVLLEGVETNIADYKLKFLRRIPRDPFNLDHEEHDGHGWLIRSTSDKPDSDLWDKKNVFDVHSASERRALDGSRYKDW